MNLNNQKTLPNNYNIYIYTNTTQKSETLDFYMYKML